MTREEIIERLRNLSEQSVYMVGKEPYCMSLDDGIALKEAVQALKQEPCEDAIPRKAVEYICRKNTVSTNPDEHEYHEKFIQFMDDPEIADFGRWQHSNGFNTALVAIKCDIDKIPSVTPKRKTGKWLMNGELYGELMWRCSECKVEEAVPTATSFITGKQYPQWHFCPNCGSYNGGEK